MIKKIFCIFCVLFLIFLTSCKKEEAEEEKITSTSTQSFETENTTENKTVTESESETVKAEVQALGKYKLTETRKDSLTEKQYDAYKIVVDGLDKGETEISVNLSDGENSFSRIKSALWSGYPLMTFVQEMNYSGSEKILSVRYTVDENTLKKSIEEFYKKVNSILTTDILYSNDFSKALLLYDYIAGCKPSDDVTLSVYDVIMNSRGTSIQFSMAYEYLLCLAGVESIHVSSESWSTNQVALTAVKLGENYYFMSPYHEAKDNNGTLLKYFGLTQDRLTLVTGSAELFSIDNDYNRTSVPQCTDDTFGFTEFLESWNYDRDKQELVYEITDVIYTYKG